ncbi:malectin/receptor-like protein kinase family protein [Actinidia rufa]|uniref:Malectin/receptor-like protein kinase family protein n=1 Tax=Actinidia rufa TaxID=165716 RepID=A0A7J0H7Z2_9ERIC|nr:malectin/receptor-like protein kinase family protein [Actinidia rufa]
MSAVDSGTLSVMDEAEESCRRFSLVEIRRATNNFDDALIIGNGGFGKVYKGIINDGATTVAIKRLNAESKQGAKEFWTEISMLSKLRHTHLVSLIGYSDDCEEMILVYENMSNGSLADHLYKFSRKRNGNDIYHLTWEQRLKICTSAARGLDYLHNTEQSVIHRDVKPSNILLDENWIAKISDFGLSRRGSTSQTQTHVSTDVKGTFGYLDPQYFLTRRLTKKSDVYAFGVLLFEVLCSRPAVDLRVEEEQCNLAIWAQQCIKKGALDQIIDPSLRGQISAHHLKVFTAVAKKCLHNHPRGRPTMAEVVENLELLLASKGNIPQRKRTIIKNWVAKVALNYESASAFNTFDAGTVGYMDPEYLATAKLTVKSDVYSFGVLLLELLCGRKPMIFSGDEDEVNLVRWFKTNIEMGTIDQIIDPDLIHKIAPECLKEYVRIAENCVRDEGMERPLMDDVLGSLRFAMQLQEAWQIKFSEVVPTFSQQYLLQ